MNNGRKMNIPVSLVPSKFVLRSIIPGRIANVITSLTESAYTPNLDGDGARFAKKPSRKSKISPNIIN
jgi:hypothetical protein